MPMKADVRLPVSTSLLPAARLAEFWRGVWVIAYREILRFSRERARWLSALVWPLLLIGVLGVGFDRIVGELAADLSYLEFLVPGIIAVNVAGSALASGLSVVWDREFGFLREVLVAPVSRGGIVLGKALGAGLIATVQGTLLVMAAPLMGVSIASTSVIALIPLFLTISIAMGCLGVLLAAFISSQRAFGAVRQAVQLPLVILSGAFFPLSVMPDWLRVLSMLNPLAYGVDAARTLFSASGGAGEAMTAETAIELQLVIFGHRAGLAEDFAVLAITGALILIAAAWKLNRQEVT